jgi:crossover junction endodeoxyribonuclease RuvC
MTVAVQAKTNTVKDKVILGIDPGTTIMGYGLVQSNGTKISLIAMGVLQLSKYDDHALRLKKIFERTLGLIEEYKPDELAVEAPFFGKNVQSMLKLGRAQGVAIAAAMYRDVPIFEYSPKKIKQSITGNGNASKEQVAAMLKNQFKIEVLPKDLDATDGLAAAVCHTYQNNSATGEKKYSGWDAFIKDNSKRVK